MKRCISALFLFFTAMSVALAGAKEYALYRAFRDKWYEEPIFWIILVCIGLCVLVYNIVKDKDKK